MSQIIITPIPSINKSLIGNTITVHGWVENIRKGKVNTFIDLVDGPNKSIVNINNSHISSDNFLQCIVSGNNSLLSDFETVYRSSFISLTGIISELPPRAKTSKGVELKVTQLLHNSKSRHDYDSIVPLNSYNHDNHILYLRHNKRRNFILLTDLVLRALNKTASNMNMVKITPPLYGSVKCEGGSELYETDHFGTPAYLTQSSQMYLEAALPATLTGTYCDSPSFRKEKSRTKRHLTQFTHWECEMFGFYNFNMFLDFLKTFLNSFFANLFKLDKFKVLEVLQREEFIKEIISKDIKILKHEEAIQILNESKITKESGKTFEPYDDIPESQERKLIDNIGSIVFLTHFPTMTKAFYTATDPSDKTRALAIDVEFPFVGEILGCSLREPSSDVIKKKLELFTLRDLSDEILKKINNSEVNTESIRMEVDKIIHLQDNDLLKVKLSELLDSIHDSDKEKFKEKINNIPYSDYKWYCDLRDYGFAMTGGFGLGVERLVTWLSGGEIIDGMHNYSIHSVTTFPRTVDKLTP